MMAPETKLAVILHADVADSTSLVRSDERMAHEQIQSTFRRIAQVVSTFGGRTRELRGDALVAEFEKTSDAIVAALAFQDEVAQGADRDPEVPRLGVRIGVALGEVVTADETMTGTGVVLAQRLEQLAEPGGVVVQGAVRDVLPKRVPVEFEDLGMQSLKGFPDPVRAYRAAMRPGTSYSPAPAVRIASTSATVASAERSDLAGTGGPRVGVLPFRNLGKDPEQEFFADGLSEEITLALSASRSFSVLANSATFAFRDRAVSGGEAGKVLGAQYILDGSVRRSGERLRVSVELVDVASQVQVWAERYERSMDDLFAIEDDITTSVVAVVEPEIDEQEMQRVLVAQPSDMGAYELAQRGFWHLVKGTDGDYRASLGLFESALGADARYARALAGMAQGKYLAGLHFWEEDPQIARQEAVELAAAALALDPRDPRALRYYGGANNALGRFDEGLRALRRAIAVQPSYATAYSALAFGLVLVGEFADALTAEATTERLRPGDRSLNICMMSGAIAAYETDDYETAEEISRKSIELNDAYWMSRLMRVAALGQQGRAKEAMADIERLRRLLPSLSQEGLSKLLPFRDRGHLEHIVEGLRKGRLELPPR